jgi:nitrite reductase (NO-forming)
VSSALWVPTTRRRRASANSLAVSVSLALLLGFGGLVALVTFTNEQANSSQTDGAIAGLKGDISSLKNDINSLKSGVSGTKGPQGQQNTNLTPNVQFTLQTSFTNGNLAFVGMGGAIDGKLNPSLNVNPGDVVKITLRNGDGIEHNVAIDEFNVNSPHVATKGQETSITFVADKAGTYTYYCTLPGHRVTMQGKLMVGQSAPQVGQLSLDVQTVAKDPTNIPPPITRSTPTTVKVTLVARELVSLLADGTSFQFWTFNGTVPGPLIRVMQGDTVQVTVVNPKENKMAHNIDLHAVNGPGGGATVSNVAPGETKTFTFKALNVGAFIYHCAASPPYLHISHGMYGAILVEPPGGLPIVDKEFYVVQGEWYTNGSFGSTGYQDFSEGKASSEQPTYYSFNGRVGALVSAFNMTANVGDKVRIIFGDGGPNIGANFHVIGEIFDKVYTGSPDTYVANEETWYVPPGSAAIFEFTLDVPGRYVLVDHALWRIAHGAAGYLYGIGPNNPSIFTSGARSP